MKVTLLVFFVIFILMQAIQVDKTNPRTNKIMEIKAPKEIKEIFVNACYDCHSNETVWPWYSNIAPISWFVKDHVEEGRKALNFEEWENYSDEEKAKLLKKIHRTIYAAMPLASYISMHEKADLTKEQRELVRDWTGVRK